MELDRSVGVVEGLLDDAATDAATGKASTAATLLVATADSSAVATNTSASASVGRLPARPTTLSASQPAAPVARTDYGPDEAPF